MIFRESHFQIDTYTFDWLGTNQWEHSGSLAGRVDYHVTTASVQSGTKHIVIVAGGFTLSEVLSLVDIYDISTQQW